MSECGHATGQKPEAREAAELIWLGRSYYHLKACDFPIGISTESQACCAEYQPACRKALQAESDQFSMVLYLLLPCLILSLTLYYTASILSPSIILFIYII